MSTERIFPGILILAFGSTIARGTRIAATEIFDSLMINNQWFVPRQSKLLRVGGTLLFYQNRRGLRGEAKLTAVSSTSLSDAVLLERLGLSHLRVKLSIERTTN